MSEKDQNFYMNFPSPFALYGMFYSKCSVCSGTFVAFAFQSVYPVCQPCLYKYYTQNTQPKPVLTKRVLQEGEKLSVSDEIAGSLLFVSDFVIHFNHLLKIEAFSFDELCFAVNSNELTAVFSNICRTFVLKLVENVYRQDSDLKINEKSLILFMGLKLFEITDVRSELEMVWPALLGEFIHLKGYKDYVKGSALEVLKQVLTSALTVDLIVAFTSEEKTAILEFLVNCFLDSKEFRETLTEKVDFQVNLTKSKTEKKQRIKQIENEMMISPLPDLEQEKSRLQIEENSLKSQIDQVFYRTVSFGQDSEGNDYYFFEFDSWRIFVNNIKPVAPCGTWKFFENDSKLKKFLSELQVEKSKEKKLKIAVEDLLSQKLQPRPESRNSVILEKHTISLEQVKDSLKNIEKVFSKYLNSSKKRWNFEADEKNWKNQLNESDSLSSIIELLLEFAEKALNPLRFQKVPKQRNIKYRKVMLKLWQNCQEGNLAWERLVKGCQSTEELMLALKVLEKVVLAYIDKKKDDSIKHGDECFKCDDGGKLIMCETCPRVAHLKCVGLVKIPIGEWQCEHCAQESKD
jgi:hypothetical protein